MNYHVMFVPVKEQCINGFVILSEGCKKNLNKGIRTSLVAAAETVAADVCWQFLAKCVDKRTQKTGSNTEAE